MIPRASKNSVVATHAGGEAFEVAVRGHIVRTDQPSNAAGRDSAPTPLELTAASLAACVALYVHRFCSKNGIDARGLAVEVGTLWRTDPGRIARFDVLLHLPASVPEHLGEALMDVAKTCPVHHTLAAGPEINVAAMATRATRPVRAGAPTRQLVTTGRDAVS